MPSFYQWWFPEEYPELLTSLRIPSDFRPNITARKSTYVYVRDMEGIIAQVWMERDDKGYIFKSGWSNLVNANNFNRGDLLMFRMKPKNYKFWFVERFDLSRTHYYQDNKDARIMEVLGLNQQPPYPLVPKPQPSPMAAPEVPPPREALEQQPELNEGNGMNQQPPPQPEISPIPSFERNVAQHNVGYRNTSQKNGVVIPNIMGWGRGGGSIELAVGGTVYELGCAFVNERTYRLGKGWSRLVKEQHLHDGQRMIFNLDVDVKQPIPRYNVQLAG